MKFRDFMQDKISVLLLNFCCALLLFMYLSFIGVGRGELILISISWVVILSSWILCTYQIKKRQLEKIQRMIDELDKKYLICEMIDKPSSYIEQEYFMIMRKALKCMTEHVSQTKREMLEYRHFIEQWVHEIKRPVTTTTLICTNHKNEYTRKIRFQMEEMERHIERVLYYARLGYVEKDYIITEVLLSEVVEEVLVKNKLLFIQNNIKVEMENLEMLIYCDKKWLVFIVNQIIINCVQYKKELPTILFSAIKKDKYIKFSIWDNGIGIKESELSRVFELGFTGDNGRRTNNSTGIGLYLCYELCKKLGIGIEVSSSVKEYTQITLIFPINRAIELQERNL